MLLGNGKATKRKKQTEVEKDPRSERRIMTGRRAIYKLMDELNKAKVLLDHASEAFEGDTDFHERHKTQELEDFVPTAGRWRMGYIRIVRLLDLMEKKGFYPTKSELLEWESWTFNTPQYKEDNAVQAALDNAVQAALEGANAGTQRPGDAEATNATRATPPGSLE